MVNYVAKHTTASEHGLGLHRGDVSVDDYKAFLKVRLNTLRTNLLLSAKLCIASNCGFGYLQLGGSGRKSILCRSLSQDFPGTELGYHQQDPDGLSPMPGYRRDVRGSLQVSSCRKSMES